MTDTVRKAADILYQRSGVEGHAAQTACQEHAQALHDAGLLAPDLPEPNDLDISAPDEKLWLPCGPTGPSVWARPGGRVRVRRIEPGDLTPDETRGVAYSMLAAADYSEGSNE